MIFQLTVTRGFGVANEVLTSGAGVLVGQASATTEKAVNSGPEVGVDEMVGAAVPGVVDPPPDAPGLVEPVPVEPPPVVVVDAELVVDVVDVEEVDFGPLVEVAVIASPLPEQLVATKTTAPRSMIPRLLFI